MSGWKIPIYVFLLAAVVLIHLAVGSFWVTGGAFAAALVAAIATYQYQTKEAGQDENSTPPSQKKDRGWIGLLDGLVSLNLMIREASVPESVIVAIESSIDSLRKLIPELNDSYVGSELTWTVNRMASDYLPRILMPYANLAPAEQAESKDELMSSLQGFESELKTIEGLVRTALVDEFKTKAAFLRARFLEEPK